ncbi:MAG: molybdopterin converting factor subunit 1 [Sulfurimicrobium sp.]|jgi:molybdopterin synthase sulfur carrier subunit|nr:molybdopterin converting factor subunit 1 [Sulfurimicrobium sp.]MDP1703512.1 molybdopterin converting factor subunit 1 [Sulfurimicrobium sp.]MDP2199219.1 molybdopterin converting factor subunit 1 [Sulfurimicrobium sp.]MDP3687683.1 molybdopterin converting factor subunit 1 [Sulfurimicrobium sp.]
MITLLYFARLREALGVSSEQIDQPADVRHVAGLTAWLRQRGGAWERELAEGRAFRVAVNQDMADGTTVIGDGDEIAIFPPVTGG